jgi:hypothetical protein
MTSRRALFGVMVASCLLAIAASFSFGRAGAAGTGVSLTTSPISIDVASKPGTTITRTLQLKNNTAQPLQINMQLEVFDAHGSSGEAAITNPSPGDPSPSWVHFSPASFVAQPDVWSTVQMTINLPKTAQLGYYYAVIFKPNIPTGTTAPGSNVVKGSNAILVLLDTETPNENRQVKIANFSVSKKLYEYLPVTFNIAIRNSGNIYLGPTGNIFISRSPKLTNTIAVLNVNPAHGQVLPDSNRDFTDVWQSGFPVFIDKTLNGQVVRSSKGQPVEQLQWNFSKVNQIRFGKYYAQLALVYNNGQRPILVTSTVSFWVIPWKLLSVALVVVILIGLGIWSISRNIIRRLRKIHRRR